MTSYKDEMKPMPFSRENTERNLAMQAQDIDNLVPWVSPKDWKPENEWKPLRLNESRDEEAKLSPGEKPVFEDPFARPTRDLAAPHASTSQRDSRTSHRSSFGIGTFGRLSFGKKWNKISPEPPSQASPTTSPTMSPPRHPKEPIFSPSSPTATATSKTYYEDGSSWVHQRDLASLVVPLTEDRVSAGRSAATFQRAAATSGGGLMSPRHSHHHTEEAIHPDVLKILKEKESLVVADRQDASSDVASTLSAGMDHFHLVMAVAGDVKSKADPSGGVEARGMSMAPRSMAYQQSHTQRLSLGASSDISMIGLTDLYINGNQKLLKPSPLQRWGSRH